ncbi:pyridoxal phosphate-dependent aminotransferase [Mesorhizobium sp. INR15]|uniref:pyridoxal phosphate-dependent aminotransferase n=1 Tax=Mesorhizobium sp. INR15 TaxID=2654248 RepID=UPI0018966C39|nr:pyridoxal phosphate-dependent aminotransferase [Mesorhizobium sp. INR15]QPC95494.1 aminotransferase class I/II-fold pyridoxal phosphate-dependent enzyme [Mesorhizobium sp. INR15]
MSLQDKFSRLGTDNAPGQEVRQNTGELRDLMRGNIVAGKLVDFSHGDVDAFTPTPRSFELFADGVRRGGRQAYTEYRGASAIREGLADKLAAFTGAPIDAVNGTILTPGTQGALFLAVASTVARGDKVAIVQPDYFANRKLVEFFEGEMVPVRLDYMKSDRESGLDLGQLEDAFRQGARVFVFSNPNNPAGAVYSKNEIRQIADLAGKYGVTVIADQLYSRLRYADGAYTHLRASGIDPGNIITIMGPSKTESLSGYRLGVAFGAPELIGRMEKLQAIVSLRAAGYSQAVLQTWFSEPEGWMDERIRLHQIIRDDLLKVLRAAKGIEARTPQAGSYLFPRLPDLAIGAADFVRILRLQANVIVTPGSEFGPHSANSVRLNFSQDRAAAVAAVKRLVEIVERYRA